MRIKRSKRIFLSNKQVFLTACALFVIVTILGLTFVSKELTPTLMEMAQNEAEQAVMYAINYGLSNASLEEMEHDVDLSKQNLAKNNQNFFIKHYDSNGNIENIVFDTVGIKDFLFKLTARIQTFMQLVESGKISIEHDSDRIIRINKKPIGTSASVPMGQVTKTSLFGNMGPNIPVHFQPLSEVETTIDRKLSEKGINNVHIQLILHVKVNVKIVLPFATDFSVQEQDIPIAEYTYPGDIPKYIDGKPTSDGSKD